MKKLLRTISAMLAISLLPVGAVLAEGEPSEYDDELVTFIVQTDYTPAALVRAEQEASGAKRGLLKGIRSTDPGAELEKKNEEILENAAKELGVDISDSIIYTEADSGFTITCRRGDAEKLLAMDGVINVEEDGILYSVPDDETPEGDTVYSDSATETAYLGQGTLIAIIDSGFDLDHPYFETAPEMPKLSEEAVAAKTASLGRGKYVSAKIPYTYDYYSKNDRNDAIEDAPEHGTHVAGIAAGKNGTFTADVGEVTINGAAPEAQIALMACSSGKNSDTFNWSVVKQAIDDAVLLGADVINMSLGSPYIDVRAYNGTTANPSILTSLTNAREAGVAVCVSQGNQSMGFYEEYPYVENINYGTSGMLSNYTDTFSVASINAGTYYDNLTRLVTGDNVEIPANTYSDSYTSDTFAATVTTVTEYVDCGKGQAEDFAGKTLTGRIALIQRGGDTFEIKTTNAKNAGAIAAIVYDNVDEPYINIANCVLPSVFVTKADGEKLAAAKNKTIYVSGTIPVKLTNTSTAEQPSSFTSWGFSETMQLTPNISAYGGNIYSAAPGGAYRDMSGTSMASPYIAGASACVKSYLNTNDISGENYAELIQQMLMSSAIPIQYAGDSAVYSPRVQGAGMVSVDNAIKAPVVLYNSDNKTLVNLGDNVGSSFTLSFTAKNLTDTEVSFDKVEVTVATDGSEDGKVSGAQKLTATPSISAVTVPAKGTADVKINVTLNSSELAEIAKTFTNGFYIDGFVKLSNDSCYAGLPFSGFYGDWGKAPIWDKTIYDDGGSRLIHEDANDANANINGTYLTTNEKNKAVKIGSATTDIVLSPANADGYHDNLSAVFTMYRASNGVTLRLVQDNSAKLSRQVSGYYSKFIQYQANDNSYALAKTGAELAALKALPDGDYTFRMTGYFDKGSGNKTAQELDFPLTITIDNTAPEISMTLSEDYKTLEVAAEDAHSIKSVTVNYKDNDGNAQTAIMPVIGNNTSENYTFTLTDANPWTISVTAVDSENNSSTNEEYAIAAQNEDEKATAFKRTLSGGSDVTYTGVSGTVTSGGISKSFTADFDSKLTPSGSDVLIGVIVEGLYDNKATAEFNLK